MALLDSFEKQGNLLFKYRGQFPILLFLLVIPFVYSNENMLDKDPTLIISYLISILGFLIRFITIGTTPKGTSGRNTKKQVADELNYMGMYSMSRHPLYLGNFLIWIGICLSTFSVFFVITVVLLFWLYYERIMFAEESFLIKKHGEKYLKWSNSVPAFVPNIFKYKKTEVSFSIISILRREYASILSAVLGFIYVEVLVNYFERNEIFLHPISFKILLITLFIVLVLRSLKHYTKLLNEHDRS
ncbi:MAG: hypothetical protein CMP69_03525 [Flavobacteriales bacterium]|nr:hypothetical protein [Flavobacteriales bacterium]MBH70295.1 hypothetical protein [Flavobacteriales bacterium]MBO98338.1 hypothetical protein [Flavobacteriales bacterium]|tara:strand:- start:14325 stop:15056 length:732 start_codon:yes stop_codon:yes gene_type:complete